MPFASEFFPLFQDDRIIQPALLGTKKSELIRPELIVVQNAFSLVDN